MSRNAFVGRRIPSMAGGVPRDGFALAIALLATLLIAALLAGLFFAVNEETRTGVAVAARDRALAVAESALEAALDGVEAQRTAPPVGGMESRSFDVNGRSAVVHMTRLDSGLFWLVAVVQDNGESGAPPRRIGALAVESRAPADSISIVRVTRQGWSELF